MQNRLVISALGQDRPGIVNELSKIIFDAGCNILDSHMSVMGGEFTIMLMTEGNWNNLAKLETALDTLGKKLDLIVNTKRTGDRATKDNVLPYAVEVVAVDHPGIVSQLTGFFSQHGINIEELRTDCYAAPHTGTPMFTINMVIAIQANMHISTMREQFMNFCDEFNLDAIMEPIKA